MSMGLKSLCARVDGSRIIVCKLHVLATAAVAREIGVNECIMLTLQKIFMVLLTCLGVVTLLNMIYAAYYASCI